MFLSVITMLAITGITVNGQIPGAIDTSTSSSCKGYGTRLYKCNTDTTIPDIGSSDANGVIGLMAIGGDNKTLVCSTDRKEKYITRAKCVLSSYRQCGDNDYKTLVMEETDWEAAFNYLCSNLAGLKAFEECIGDSITDCKRNREAREKVTNGAQPYIDNPFTDISDHHCKRLKIQEECVADDEDVATCVGSSGNRALYEEFYRLKKASVCGASSIILASGLLVISLFASFVKF